MARAIPLVLALTVAAGLGWPHHARADQVIVTNAAPAHSGYGGPNSMWLRHGLVTFAISYGTSVVVAFESDKHSDRDLYIPVAGPWLDLSDRGKCRGCANETLAKVMLVADGIFQGIGMLEILGAFVLPESSDRASAALKPVKAGLSAAPMLGFGTLGVRALAAF